MFVCYDCIKPDERCSVLPISRGPCERCQKVKDCHEVYIHKK